MKLAFVNIMQELQRFDSTAYITQPPVPLAVLNAVTPKEIETALIDEQTDRIEFEGDVFAFSVSTQNALAVYEHADALRAAGKKVIMGGIHVTVCPEEAMRHADAIVTGEAETIWPAVCADLLSGKLRSDTPGPDTAVGRWRLSTTDSSPIGVISRPLHCSRPGAVIAAARSASAPATWDKYRTKPLDVLEREIDQLSELYPSSFLQFTDDNLLVNRKIRFRSARVAPAKESGVSSPW